MIYDGFFKNKTASLYDGTRTHWSNIEMSMDKASLMLRMLNKVLTPILVQPCEPKVTFCVDMNPMRKSKMKEIEKID